MYNIYLKLYISGENVESSFLYKYIILQIS